MVMGKEDQATPMSNQFLEFRFDKIDSTLQTIMDHIEANGRDFNNHKREDAILNEQVRVLMEEKRSNAGLWAGIAGVGTAVGSFIYSVFGR
jgi:hypothetical protein